MENLTSASDVHKYVTMNHFFLFLDKLQNKKGETAKIEVLPIRY